jgi:hypothetical protein
MQCPKCKSRKGYYKLSTRKNGQARFRTLICKAHACILTSVEVYPEPYTPNIKYKVKESFPSLNKRLRVYWVDKSEGTTFCTSEQFEDELPQYQTIDNRNA